MTCKEQKTIAVFGAFCLFLSTIEYMIPKPVPFLRLGLANLPLILALDLSFSSFTVLVLVKVFAQALISGTLFSSLFLFSFAGTAASASIMFLLKRLFFPRWISFIGISIAGALCSNIMQIILARFLILGPGAFFIAPPILAAGIATGLLLGIFCRKFTNESVWYQRWQQQQPDEYIPQAPEYSCSRNISSFFPLAAILFFSLVMIFMPWTGGQALLFVICWIFAAIKKKAGNPFGTLFFFASIVLFNLITPYGRLLVSIGPFSITEGALRSGISKASVIEGLIMLSRAAIPRNITLPGRFGAIISESLRILTIITKAKKSLPVKNFIHTLDTLLETCFKAR